MTTHTLTSQNWPQPRIIDYNAQIVLFGFVYVKSLIKSQSHETMSSMKLPCGAPYVIKVQEIDNTRPIFVSNGIN